MKRKRVYRLYREEGLQVRTTKRGNGPLTCGFHIREQSGRISAGAWIL